MMSELPASSTQPLEVNGRLYQRPKRPTVVVCFDGCDPSYLAAAGMIPVLDRMQREGFSAIALAAMPTFTNPNNVSVAAACRRPDLICFLSL